MSYNYRCTIRRRCGHFLTTKQPRQSTVCPKCDQPTLKDVTKYERQQTQRKLCKCNSHHFPHRKGSKGCIHSATYEQDMRERHGDIDYDNLPAPDDTGVNLNYPVDLIDKF